MKKLFFPLAVCLLFVFSAFAAVMTQGWSLGKDYSVKFSTPKGDGIFRKLEGDISFDPAKLNESRFNVRVDASSINTGNGMKNNHAKKDEFLDVAKYPNISFASSQITKSGSGYQVKGTLELHGVKKEITFPFTFQGNAFKGGFQVKGKDYGIAGLGDGNDDIVKIDLNVPVTKK